VSLDFISPDLERPFNGATPRLRSPIHRVLEASGARFEQRDGWDVASDYGAIEAERSACRAAVGVADRSCLGKLELQGPPEVVAEIVAQLAGGQSVHPGQAVTHGGTWWCPLTPSRVLALSTAESTPRTRLALGAAAAASDASVSVIELTSALGSNLVVGPLARETFARLTALDLRASRLGAGGFAPGSVARTPGMVLREGGDRFIHLFGAGYAEYIWTVVLDAAESLGGRAVGIEALSELTAGNEASAGA
jgi:glycine cleavage system aminomethyltransferase T